MKFSAITKKNYKNGQALATNNVREAGKTKLLAGGSDYAELWARETFLYDIITVM